MEMIRFVSAAVGVDMTAAMMYVRCLSVTKLPELYLRNVRRLLQMSTDNNNNTNKPSSSSSSPPPSKSLSLPRAPLQRSVSFSTMRLETPRQMLPPQLQRRLRTSTADCLSLMQSDRLVPLPADARPTLEEIVERWDNQEWWSVPPYMERVYADYIRRRGMDVVWVIYWLDSDEWYRKGQKLSDARQDLIPLKELSTRINEYLGRPQVLEEIRQELKRLQHGQTPVLCFLQWSRNDPKRYEACLYGCC